MSWLLIIFLFCSRTTHFSAWRINSRTPPGKWYLEIFLKYKLQHLFTSFVLKKLIQIYLGKPCPAQSTILRLALAQQQNSGQREFIQEKGNWQWYMWSLLTRDRNGMAHHVWVPLCKGLLGVAPGADKQHQLCGGYSHACTPWKHPGSGSTLWCLFCHPMLLALMEQKECPCIPKGSDGNETLPQFMGQWSGTLELQAAMPCSAGLIVAAADL